MGSEEKITRPDSESFLETLPPVEFCCIYGSILHPNNSDKTSMIDYILGVKDPLQWHAENLKMNRNHYASWLTRFGGVPLITKVSENVGVGVHFNPFVSHNGRLFKYGVVKTQDLVEEVQGWRSFYLSGRLQKPVNVIFDEMDVEKHNFVNLKAAIASALLLLPSNFSEEQLYSEICNLSYKGDLRMLFAEDKNKVRKIVEGQFKLFQEIYKPHLEEFATHDLCRFSSSVGRGGNIIQDCGVSSTSSIVSSLPLPIRSQMEIELGEVNIANASDRSMSNVVVKSKERAALCLQKILRHKVMVSSARQAIAGFLTVGPCRGFRYLGKKMQKSWRS